jgi:acetoin:2,6-dichlorophenolindophenol oxidoreductase subunit alpha
MTADLWPLYQSMLRSRLFEEAIAGLWHDGLISGEMHLGTGEEAIIAGVVAHLHDGDAIALGHRGTAALLMRGLAPYSLLREILGCEDGLCGGRGGHMHLFSEHPRASSSGIVGASGPTAAGFALAAQLQHSDSIAVAFFGEGAMNQGMLMESMNLASVWHLPVLFVCKDDGWAIATETETTTGGDLAERARGLGMESVVVDGRDVIAVWEETRVAAERARNGEGPTFLRARCVHLEGHFLGFQLLRAIRKPGREMPEIVLPLTRSLLRRGSATLGERVAALGEVVGSVVRTLRDPRQDSANDPVRRAREILAADPDRLKQLEEATQTEVNAEIRGALEGVVR